MGKSETTKLVVATSPWQYRELWRSWGFGQAPPQTPVRGFGNQVDNRLGIEA